MNFNNYEPRRKLFKAIFIDGSFLFHCVQGMSGIRIDYRKLINVLLSQGEHLQICSYYTALPNEYDMEEKHRNFIKILKKDVRVRVRSVPLLKSHDMSTEPNTAPIYTRYSKGEDILLACDLVKGAVMNHFDSATIVTGDADFIPAVHMAMDAGKRITVASFHGSLSHVLEMECSDVIYLDEKLDQIRL